MSGATPFPAQQEGAAEIRALDPNVRQRRASDPSGSAWVGASAGTGKTKVLTDRVLRLLLPRPDGSPGSLPQRILCLTFTKAAASEMALRIGRVLGAWAVMPEEELRASLTQLTGRDPGAAELAAARRLFAATVDTPGGLKIMTIHSFCQSVLSRFPLEAGLPPQFSVLEETGAAAPLLTQARDRVIAAHPAMAHLAALLNEEQFGAALADVCGERMQLQALLARAGSIEALYEEICARLGLAPGATPDILLREACADAAFDADALRRCCRALAGGKKTDLERSHSIQEWLECGQDARIERFDAYCKAYLTEGKLRKTLATKDVLAADPECDPLLRREGERLIAVREQLRAAECAGLTRDLLDIGAAIVAGYRQLKERAGRLDFDDLIIRTLALFERPGIAPWVLFKLDGGLDHILIDEAQDTNPEQWRIIATLCEEFFAGNTARDGVIRTLFTVGDMKQSIFSFQRAAPEEFSRMRAHFRTRITAAEQGFTDEALDISFRTVASVLRLVDETFAPEAMHAGMGEETVRHHSRRAGQAGFAELWPLFEAQEQEKEAEAGWSAPVTVRESRSGASRLADHIGATIRGWLDAGEMLPARGRAVRPGDIMILVRTRTAFVGQLVRALKTRGIPVSGVDRMVLGEQLAVMDLLAAADFALLPENDLALACLLKSPLLGWSEERLYAACIDRGRAPLWRRVQEQAGEAETAWLRGLIASAASDHPYEFFAQLLQRPCPGSARSGMTALLARLGSEAADPVEEFLAAALSFERANTPTLQGFLSWQKNEDITIKRELEEAGQAVRIMTVHGSKGLQAPIVFMPDTTRTSAARRLPRLLWPEKTGMGVPLWSPRKDSDCAAFTAAQAQAGAALDEEYRRLLYVAMTRAEDRLYIAGHTGKKAALPDSWYYAVKAAFETLGDAAEQIPFPAGGAALRFSDSQQKPPDRAAAPAAAEAGEKESPLPGWALRPAPAEPSPPQPLAPSRPSEPEPPVRSPRAGADLSRFRRGELTHKLLQILPNMPQTARADAAAAFLAQPGHGLAPGLAAEIARETLAILQHPDFAPLFGPGSLAEVPLTGLVNGRLVSGQIDRLLIAPDTVSIVDFKTNRPPPREAHAVPALYQSQLAAYRATLAAIYPGRAIRSFLLWTDGPILMEIT